MTARRPPATGSGSAEDVRTEDVGAWDVGAWDVETVDGRAEDGHEVGGTLRASATARPSTRAALRPFARAAATARPYAALRPFAHTRAADRPRTRAALRPFARAAATARPRAALRPFARAPITLAAVLVAFGVTFGLRRLLGFGPQNVVLAVVLTMTLTRVLSLAEHHPAVVTLEVPLLGLAAGGAGWLVLDEPWIGQPLLVVALSVGILARRWGGLARQAGRLVALPFLAVLVTPAPRLPGAPSALSSVLWSPVVGGVALLCAAGAITVQRRAGVASARSGESSPRRASSRRIDPATRMAAQMAAGLGAALVLGHLLFGAHWVWCLISAFVVASGNRGRGDVAHKAALRLAGAGVGTLGVSLATLGLPAGNRWLIVALFVALGVSLALREYSYAFWAAGVTAMIALLHGYYGDVGAGALRERVLGVLVGSALGLAAAWFVLPVRATDVLRRRVADCLAALSHDLDPNAEGPATAPAALHALDEITPAWRAHRRSLGRRHDVHPLLAVDALHRLADLPDDVRQRRRLRRDVGRVRRAIVGHDDPPPSELPPDLATVHALLQATARPAPRPPASLSGGLMR